MTGTATNPIDKRTLGNRKRISRLEKMKSGPGVFVYTGGWFIEERKPTVKMRMERVAELDEDGAPKLDANMNIIEKLVPSGKPMRNHDGTAMLGGKPKIKRTELDVVSLRSDDCPEGVDFKRDVPTEAKHEGLALKARLLKQLHELEGEELEAFYGGKKGLPKPPKPKPETKRQRRERTRE